MPIGGGVKECLCVLKGSFASKIFIFCSGSWTSSLLKRWFLKGSTSTMEQPGHCGLPHCPSARESLQTLQNPSMTHNTSRGVAGLTGTGSALCAGIVFLFDELRRGEEPDDVDAFEFERGVCSSPAGATARSCRVCPCERVAVCPCERVAGRAGSLCWSSSAKSLSALSAMPERTMVGASNSAVGCGGVSQSSARMPCKALPSDSCTIPLKD